MEMEPLFDLTQYLDSKEPDDHDMDMLSVHLGEEQAAAVVLALGGLSFRVPSSTSGERYTYLVNQLGAELAAKLVDVFGGEELYVPKKYQSGVNEKHRQVRQRYTELRKTMSNMRAIQELAREMELSDRQIRRIIG